MSQKLLQTKTMMDRESAAEKLHNLADKIGEGRIELKSESESVVLEPADKVEFELEVEEESDGDLSIEIEVEWSQDHAENDVEII